jgi:molybdopterin-containing oxidoreductase family membrane subunit
MTISHDEQEVAIEQRFVAKAKDINEEIAWAQINEDVLRSLERPRPLYWVIFLASLALFSFGVYCRSSQ